MFKKILLILITMTFSFINLMAMDDEYAYFCASSKDRTTYTFSQEVETMKEEEESPLSDKDFLEVEKLLKKESQIRDELAATKSQRREITRNDPCLDICYNCYDPISTFFLINLVKEEDEIEFELKELDQQTQGLMRDIYLRTGRQHPKMRVPTDPAYR